MTTKEEIEDLLQAYERWAQDQKNRALMPDAQKVIRKAKRLSHIASNAGESNLADLLQRLYSAVYGALVHGIKDEYDHARQKAVKKAYADLFTVNFPEYTPTPFN